MFLKCIELAGFKSFTERTVIKLDGGISCIVGPNGSGKSNISDAVRWVLGEQSARILRGQRMEDVIFAGSDKRKPLGMAEVSLHIDNSDGALPVEYTEVVVCRRAYRNGDSEYLLNGRQCRLTDIRELFMDSGISNNSLALIGQGRIQEVVNMKPEERRQLLEDAAGIMKYRARKRTALRKLADCEQNLTRIWDIISELAVRLEPLAAQSAKAEKYLGLKEGADRQEILLLTYNIRESRRRLAELAELLRDRRDQAAAAEAGRIQAEASLAEQRMAADRAEEALANLRQQLFDLKSSREAYAAEKRLLEEKSQGTTANIERLGRELAGLLNQDSGYVAETIRLREAAAAARQELLGLEQEIAASEQRFGDLKEGIEQLAAEQEMTRQELLDNTGQLANTKNELAFLRKSLADSRQGAESTRERLAEMELGGTDAAREIAGLEAEIATLAQEREQSRREREQLERAGEELRQQLTAANEGAVALRLRLNSEESRLKVLSEMDEHKSGFYPGVRAVLRASGRQLAGVCGVVVDLIEAEPRFGTALEAAAGAGLQNIVVEDDRAAKACVAYLKAEKLGRATFLPLADLRLRLNQEIGEAAGEPGVIGRCSQVIRCREEYRRAVDFIFGNILLVEDLEAATAVAKKYRQQFRIVTLGGDIISPGGSITGGSRQKNSSELLQKKNQLAELRQNVSRLQQESEKRQGEIAELDRRQQALEERRRLLQEAEQQRELAYLGKIKDIGHLRDGLADRGTQMAELRRELAENERQQGIMTGRCEELAAEIAGWDRQTEELNAQLSARQQQQESQEARLEAVRRELEEARVLTAQRREQYQGLEAEAERLTSQKSSLFQQHAAKKAEQEALQGQLESYRQEAREKQTQILALTAELGQTEAAVNAGIDQCGQIRRDIEALEKQAAELGSRAGALNQELHQLEVKEARYQTEEEGESRKLAEGFELAFEEAEARLNEAEETAELEPQHLSASLNKLKKELAALGSVNLEAIEEYKSVRERHDFLTAQREDLLEAHTSLNRVIKEMDEIMTRRFRETFEQVNRNFCQTFHQLFGGGGAALLLTDPDDLLESGVDLEVQPPGKRLINYNLLSGGEKSLIGVALVLAIFQAKPSPFCILDEVDAALDEANVDRFAEYIKEFKENTQFIVVTHRQGTMEAADRLWGVTMEKDGVSKIVSVKLTDDLQEYVS